MIIICPCGEKRFEVDANLIPDKGRLLKCGSCEQTWFFDKNVKNDQSDADLKKTISSTNKQFKNSPSEAQKKTKKPQSERVSKVRNNQGSEIIKYESKLNFSFITFLSYILVAMISFIALIIILDTFKTPLYSYFPNLEILLFNFFETITDIKLFIKDLI